MCHCVSRVWDKNLVRVYVASGGFPEVGPLARNLEIQCASLEDRLGDSETSKHHQHFRVTRAHASYTAHAFLRTGELMDRACVW